MREQKVIVYCGEGKGKTAAALGYAIQSASHGERVIIIQFLKGKKSQEMEFLRRLEPEVKGVVVVCQGGDDPLVVRRVVETVRVALNISSSRISVSRLAGE